MKCPNCSHEFDEKAVNKKLKPTAIIILEHLNKMAGKSYRPVKANLDFIIGRLSEGAKEETMMRVVDKKCLEWRNTDMKTYLRPATLFNATKFAQYEGEIVEPKVIKRSHNECATPGCKKVGVIGGAYRAGTLNPRYCSPHYYEIKRKEEEDLELKYRARI